MAGIDPMSIATSIANPIASFVGAAQQRKFEEQQADKQMAWNESMMDKQNAWTLDMWNRTNAYNDPAAQKERLLKAGLNPLYYGLDGSSANGAESAQALGFDRASMNGITNPLQAAVNAELMTAQVENVRADTAKKANENLSETVRREQMKVQIDKERQEIESMKTIQNLNESQKKAVDKGIEWTDRLNQANIDYQKSMQALNESTKKRIDELLEGEKILQAKNIVDFDKRWQKISAEISKIAKENKILDLDAENYALNHMQSGAFGSGLSLPNLVRAMLDPGNPEGKTTQEMNQGAAPGSDYMDVAFPDVK